MQYVNVLKGPKPFTKEIDVMPSVLMHTKNLLVSLEYAFGKAFEIKKVDEFHKTIQENIKARYSGQEPKVWIDSGGFSFIGGKLPTAEYQKIIACYDHFLRNCSTGVDVVFSLDLPSNASDPSYSNDKRRIKQVNTESLSAARAALEKDTSLKKKFYYAIQFLKPYTYGIWRELYDELELEKFVENRAIGGMVGARKSKRAVPSPFIGIAYRCLVDFTNAQRYHHSTQFKLHFLGVYLLQDRFEILLLEKLFQRVLNNVEVVFTYDSAVFSRKASIACLTLPAFIPTDSGGYQYIPNFDDVNVNTDIQTGDTFSFHHLEKIFDQSNMDTARQIMELSFAKREAKLKSDILKRVKDENEVKKTDTPGLLEIFQPFNILSNKCMDEILSRSIDLHSLVNLFDAKLSEHEHKKEATNFIMKVSHCDEDNRQTCSDLFSLAEATLYDNVNLLWAIRRNIIETYHFHKWFLERRDDTKLLDQMQADFVRDFHDPKKVW